MPEITPAIIAKDFREVTDKIRLVEPYVKWVQLDIMDGNFVENFTWNNPDDLKYYDPGVFLEAHLMTTKPEDHAGRWIDAGIKRIIFHFEATRDPFSLIKLCREKKIDVGVAINPETPAELAKPLLGFNPNGSVGVKPQQTQQTADTVLVMGVSPGAGGQKFQPSVIAKIRALRNAHPYLTIEVDGGMNPESAKKAAEAGADVIVAGSYIFNSDDVEKAINDLKTVL